MPVCKMCKEAGRPHIKPEREFYTRVNKAGIIEITKPICKSCLRGYQKSNYQRHPSAINSVLLKSYRKPLTSPPK